MYQKPKLVHVGEVEKVVRGILASGDDLDGTWLLPSQEYEGEVEDEEESL